MRTELKDKENNEKEILVTLTPADMEQYLERAAQRLALDMKVKGFRDGQIPRRVVENVAGKNRVWNEAASEAMESSYTKAMGQQDIEPIGRPKADIIKLVPDNDFEFKITIPVMPALTLPDYKKIAADIFKKENKESKGVTVEEKEVEDALQWLRKTRIPTDSGENTDSHEQKVGGLPEIIDDKFAESVGGFKTLKELKDSMKDGIKKEKENRERERVRLKILDAILEKVNFQISDILVEQELDKMEDELARQVGQMGMAMEDYLKKIGKKQDELRAGWRQKAQQRVSTAILLRSIGNAEKIEVSEEEVEQEVGHYLSQFNSIDEAKRHIDPILLSSYIRGILRNKKVFELLGGGNNLKSKT